MTNTYLQTGDTNHIVDKDHDQFDGVGVDVDTPVLCGRVIPSEDIQSTISYSQYDAAATIRSETGKDICSECERAEEKLASREE